MHKAVKTAAAGFAAAMISLSAAHATEPLVDAKAIPGDFSANVAAVSEYFFRGISQTDDKPALQGGFDYSVPLGKSGVNGYLGLWGSNVEFNEAAGVHGATIESDWYGGVNGSLGSTGVGWDLGAIYYWYPGADSSLNYDYWEAQAKLSYDFGFASTTASFNYSPDNFGKSGAAYYPALSVDVPVGKYLTLSGHVGKQYVKKNATFGYPDYVDYSIGGTVNVVGFDLNVTYTGTDMNNSECSDACDMVYFSISRSF